MEERKFLRGRKLELYVNLKYPQNKVLRPIRFGDEVFSIDPRTLILDKHDAIIENIVKSEKLKVALDFDKTMENCMKWVQENCTYSRDYIEKNKINNWQLPSITAQRKTGDCEDSSLLLISLAIAANIPYYRLKIVSGIVQKNPTAPEGGHAWVFYLRESDNEWEVWESTAKTTNGNKGLAKDLIGKSWYKQVNWTANKKYTFSQKEIKITDGNY